MLTRIGNIEIWRILEGISPFLTPLQAFPDLGEDGMALMRRIAARQICPETGQFLIPIQAFLIKTPQHVILIDGCVGNHKTFPMHPHWHNRSDNRFLAGLTVAGVSPEDVDYVMCTHLHVDHVGWNTRLENGQWVPTFPNARYVFPATDHAHFAAEAGDVYTESVLPVIAANQAELVSADHKLGDHIAFIPTPGHTPGHVSIEISDGPDRAVITGDVMHTAVQCLRPSCNFAFDADKVQAVASRHRLMEHSSEGGHLVIGSHFQLPSTGVITATPNGFDWTER